MTWAYELGNIEYAYTDTPVLAFDDLKIPGSEITALVGPNGSGKSTLLNILGFLDYPGRGKISFFGQDVSTRNYNDFRRRTGYVQQKPYLFHTTVFKNIESGLKIRGIEKSERRLRVARSLSEFGLSKLAARHINEISGGEAQKVAIARAMVLNPEVLILDEPFSHLDKSFRADLEDTIKMIARDDLSTLIFTTHDHLQAKMVSDRIYSLIDGKVAPLSAVNLYSGTLHDQIFYTGNIAVSIPPHIGKGNRLAIDSNQLVLSRNELDSSMRNRYYGKVIRLSEENGQIHVIVQAGEEFNAVITPAALADLGINIGDNIWVSFKSTSVHLF